MTVRIYWALALVGAFGLTALMSGIAQAGIAGRWANEEGNSHIKIELCGDSVCGTIVWLKMSSDEDGAPLRDRKNRDESLRNRPIVGIRLLYGFKPVSGSPNAWDGGRIYNPRDGVTYKSNMRLRGDNILEVKGCVLSFCKSQSLTRIE